MINFDKKIIHSQTCSYIIFYSCKGFWHIYLLTNQIFRQISFKYIILSYVRTKEMSIQSLFDCKVLTDNWKTLITGNKQELSRYLHIQRLEWTKTNINHWEGCQHIFSKWLSYFFYTAISVFYINDWFFRFCSLYHISASPRYVSIRSLVFLLGNILLRQSI